MRKNILLVVLFAFVLSACGQAVAVVNPPAPAATSLPPALPEVLAPAITETPRPADTSVPAPTVTPELTLAPTPTLHPMDIRAMRQGSYPGSEITLEQELDRGINYRRFYASYLSEGLRIYALLTIPDGEMPEGGWPAIVFNHGYIPPDVYVTTERYIAYVDRLASAGYIVFRIDYRGHDRSEGEATGAYGNPGYAADVLNAVASLKQFHQANPNKIGMWGHSMGGYLTLRAMVISPDVRAGVIWGGVVASYPDMLSRWRRGIPTPLVTNTPSVPIAARRWRQAWVQDFGTPEENPAFWAGVSANSYLADLAGPVQLHHGRADEEVPVEFSETLAQQIQAAGGTVELFTYEGDNHNISNYFTAAMNETVWFFDRYLK